MGFVGIFDDGVFVFEVAAFVAFNVDVFRAAALVVVAFDDDVFGTNFSVCLVTGAFAEALHFEPVPAIRGAWLFLSAGALLLYLLSTCF